MLSLKISLNEEAQLALDNIVKILDANHNLLHGIHKKICDQNELMKQNSELMQKSFDLTESFFDDLAKQTGKFGK